MIDDVKLAEPKFAQGPSDFDICIHVTHAEDANQADWWRGEISQNYGRGNFASMTQAEITMQTLRKVGFEGNDLTTAKQQLVGKTCPATIKATEKDGKTYFNVQYIGAGGGDHPKEIDDATVKARMAALFGGAADAAPVAPVTPTPKPTPPPAAAPKNSFASSGAAPAGGAKPNPFAGGGTTKKSPF